MAALFRARSGKSGKSGKYGQDLARWMFSMFTIVTFPISYRYAPLRVQLAYSHFPKRRFSNGITSDNRR